MGNFTKGTMISELFAVLVDHTSRWVLADTFQELPEYADESGSLHPFLGELALDNLRLPANPEEYRIAFSGDITKSSTPFLQELLCYDELPKTLRAECCISQNTAEDTLFFRAECLCQTDILLCGIRLPISGFSFASGLSREVLYRPELGYCVYLEHGGARILLTARRALELYDGSLELSAELNDVTGYDNLTIQDILSLFGLKESFPFYGLLPMYLPQTLFNGLRLQYMNIVYQQGTITQLEFKAAASEVWELCEGISFLPCFTVFLNHPFQDGLEQITVAVSGEWTLGSSTYILEVNPHMGKAAIGLKEGESLDFRSMADTLMRKAVWPEIEIDTLKIFVNFPGKEFEFVMHASKVWSFAVWNRTFSITGVGLRLLYSQSQTTLMLTGEFLFLDIGFEAVCSYQGDEMYTFSANTEGEAPLLKLLGEFLDEQTVSQYIPDMFADVMLEKMRFSYSREAENSELYLVGGLKKVLVISDGFKIDEFLLEFIYRNGQVQAVNVFARFYVAGCGIWLSVKKEEQSICCTGQSGDGQQIAFPEMAESFFQEILHYDIRLPDVLLAFQISRIGFSYNSGSSSSYTFDCTAGWHGEEAVLSKLFAADVTIHTGGSGTAVSWSHTFNISCKMVFNQTQIMEVSYSYGGNDKENANCILLKYQADKPEDGISFGEILETAGFENVHSSWSFLTESKLSSAEMSYDFSEKKLSAKLALKSGGTLAVSVICKENFDYEIILHSALCIELGRLPVVGGIISGVGLEPEQFSLSNLSLHALSEYFATEKQPEGVALGLRVMGAERYCQIYTPGSRSGITDEKQAPKVFWMKIDKNVAIFCLHRIGVSLDEGRLGILFDAGLNAAPLSFELLGLGMELSLNQLSDVRFVLSGMQLSFVNPSLSIAGSFMRTGNPQGEEAIYAGSLAIMVGTLSAFAVGQYSKGSLMAYACLDIPLGGPPAFFVKGFALGFGYNQALTLPDITEVAAYPLIQGAKGNRSREAMIEELAEYIKPMKGQSFLAAGVHFTSFEIADSFVLATVSFGKKLEVGILGVSDISMPPEGKGEPLAHAQLALKAAFLPEDGLLCVEARLTDESFILSKRCRLTGGFAFFLWFGGEHEGDFVISLGGYGPKYQKPGHYPDVPRLGFCWDVMPESPNRLVLSGDMYFALTPSVMMAGGRLSAVYTDGNLRAWFDAKADFLLVWKPFSYDITIGISIGASYRIKIWFVQCTFKLELGCRLHIWGPDFSVAARITWFIISFDIRYAAGALPPESTMNWEDFSSSFLPNEKGGNQNEKNINPITLSVNRGIIGGTKENPGVCGESFELSCTTVFPCTELEEKIDNRFRSCSGAVYVRPMKKQVTRSSMELELISNGTRVDCEKQIIKGNAPGALWTPEGGSEELLKGALRGFSCTLQAVVSAFFPLKTYISAELLSSSNRIERYDAFEFESPHILPDYIVYGTIPAVMAGKAALEAEGRGYLEQFGYYESCDISQFTAKADILLDEDVFVGEIGFSQAEGG